MIRPANPADAPAISQLILLAMGNALAGKFANSNDPEVVDELFTKFAGQPGNQYSYENALLWEEDSSVCGMILAYDGGQLDALRIPFLTYTRTQLGFTGTIEDETQSSEFYIDCLGVFPQYQGKGIAKKLIKALFIRAAELGHQTVGLLVSKGNDKAQKLYTGLGFEIVGEQALLGGIHYHLQFILP
ncbi:GNAT family N-acetyltransferase [Mucilaginibacter gilvus]|uniref:GNAT family N-acetyltransferase n=1 Tax=Mucilaginibacter gilvus TaxID=2305909 RepID=A0A444MIR9_9SPHI|nr:GNAT family N-acetyltransferase [Mucilaginibacter gilvus]RWY47993.1 GNAT family N-acetyltransferase [Mucilaginibacter gilvus]